MVERRRKRSDSDASGELPTERSPTDDELEDGGAFLLVVIDGPDKGKTLDVTSSLGRVLVGTSPMCALRLTDREVSRRHVALRLEGSGRELAIADLGSTNGTSVNGVSLREAGLRGGEVVRVGRTMISVKAMKASDSRDLAATRDVAFGRLIGESLPMRGIYPLLHRAAASTSPVLLEGEVGTGKELAAEEIHARSSRAVRPFIVLEANALSPEAIEARLFGGCVDEQPNVLEQASQGTLFIDEVAAVPLHLQRRLLHAFDDPRLDVRFILATRRDLDRDVAERRFDESLLARLAAMHIVLPPLRERAGDEAVLSRAFWETLRSEAIEPPPPEVLPADFLPRFSRYAWPGNVRELLLAVRARLVLGEMAPWRTAELSRVGSHDVAADVIDRELPLSDARKLVVDDFERRYVSHMLARFGNTRDAARASGVALRYLQLLRARLLP